MAIDSSPLPRDARSRKREWITAALAAALIVNACESPTQETNVPAIHLGATVVALEVGERRTLPVELTRDGVPVVGEPVSFLSSNPEAVSVDERGELVGRSVGTAEITVTGLGLTATATVTVVEGEPATLALGIGELTLDALGDSVRIGLEAFNRHGASVSARPGWTSLDESVATVSQAGVVRAVGNGATSVRASVGLLRGIVDVTVRQAIEAISIELPAGTSPVIRAGSGLQLTAAGFDPRGHTVPDAALGGQRPDPRRGASPKHPCCPNARSPAANKARRHDGVTRTAS